MDTNLLSTIGQTPLVELIKISPNPKVRILAKLEFMNPTASIKDRIVRHIILDAEEKGLLKAGGTIVENTSGNTGAAVAMIAAQRGYKAILTMPDKVSLEKQNALKAYGAKIVVTPTSAAPDSPDHYVNTAKRIAAETPNSFRINQYDNKKNPEAHFLTTGPEIWEQTNGDADIFVASGSTGGTITGIGGFLKSKNPQMKVWMADPIGSIYYDYFKTGEIPISEGTSYMVEGVGEDHIALAMDFSIVDEMLQFNDKQAFSMARRLAREEGILAGGTSGANLWAACEIAKLQTENKTIITVLPDHGIKYLSKFHNDEWFNTQFGE